MNHDFWARPGPRSLLAADRRFISPVATAMMLRAALTSRCHFCLQSLHTTHDCVDNVTPIRLWQTPQVCVVRYSSIILARGKAFNNVECSLLRFAQSPIITTSKRFNQSYKKRDSFPNSHAHPDGEYTVANILLPGSMDTIFGVEDDTKAVFVKVESRR